MTVEASMDAVERRMERLLTRLARENRCLLFLLRRGYSLAQAEALLRHVARREGSGARPHGGRV
jgi:SOS response regulatory protein OraA/RecX